MSVPINEPDPHQVAIPGSLCYFIFISHPEMSGQIDKIHDTLLNPDIIVRSRTDSNVELFYQHYKTTPISEKYLCIIVKILVDDLFIITAYFTDTIKRGEVLWKKK